MKIVEQDFTILSPRAANSGDYLESAFIREARIIELAGRTANKSEKKTATNSYDAYIRSLIKRGEVALLKFGSMAVKFVTDQGVANELARHELGVFAQEDICRCNYDGDKFGRELTVVKPSTWGSWSEDQRKWWKESLEYAELNYLYMVQDDMEPQEARSVLPSSLKIEVVARANFREWRRILRFCAVSKAAHSDIRALMLPLYEQCRKLLPCVFDMGEPE